MVNTKVYPMGYYFIIDPDCNDPAKNTSFDEIIKHPHQFSLEVPVQMAPQMAPQVCREQALGRQHRAPTLNPTAPTSVAGTEISGWTGFVKKHVEEHLSYWLEMMCTLEFKWNHLNQLNVFWVFLKVFSGVTLVILFTYSLAGVKPRPRLTKRDTWVEVFSQISHVGMPDNHQIWS